MPFQTGNYPLLHPHLDRPQIGTLTHKGRAIFQSGKPVYELCSIICS